MKHKGKVLELFVEWKKNLEKSTGRKTKVLWSNNGSKYKSDPFLKLRCEEGIDRHFTVKETLQKRGSRKDEQDFAREGPLYIIHCQITKELLG